MNTTGIEWCDFTSNPIAFHRSDDDRVVWGCVKVSAGCANCYAESVAQRFRRGGPFTVNAMERLMPFVDEAEIRRIVTSRKIAVRRVFVGDMTDIFGEWVNDALLDRVFAAMALRPDVTFQVLTKRPERMSAYAKRVAASRPHDAVNAAVFDAINAYRGGFAAWPLPNVHLGVSVENQAAADERIPLLLDTPAALRFLSVEPMLGPVEFSDVTKRADAASQCGKKALAGIGWVIVGSESGPASRRRPMDEAWVRSVKDQCVAAGVPFFFKQAIRDGKLVSLPELDGRAWAEFPR